MILRFKEINFYFLLSEIRDRIGKVGIVGLIALEYRKTFKEAQK